MCDTSPSVPCKFLSLTDNLQHLGGKKSWFTEPLVFCEARFNKQRECVARSLLFLKEETRKAYSRDSACSVSPPVNMPSAQGARQILRKVYYTYELLRRLPPSPVKKDTRVKILWIYIVNSNACTGGMEKKRWEQIQSYMKRAQGWWVRPCSQQV